MVNKKGGVAFVWVSTLVIIFALAVLYLAIDKPLNMINDKLGGDMSEEFSPSFEKIFNTFKVWPLILVFGLLIGAVIISTRQPDSETRGFL